MTKHYPSGWQVMSTHYNVHCSDHPEAKPLFPEGVRNGDQSIRELMECRQELIALARVSGRCERLVPHFEAIFKVCIGERIDLSFFDEHDTCRLVMRDEYGDEEEVGR